MVERSVDPSVIQAFGSLFVGPLIGWSFGRVAGSFNLSVCSYGFRSVVGCLIGGFVCFFRLVGELFGWLVNEFCV